MENINNGIWIRYLSKKDIIKSGLRNYENNQKEIKEFKQMLYRLKKSSSKHKEKKVKGK